MADFEKYPKPAVAVDILVLYWDGHELQLPLIQRRSPPFQGQWAFPGGFLNLDETLEEAATRELGEETGLQAETLLRGPIFDAVGRDPRGRVISVPHIAFVAQPAGRAQAGDDAADAKIFKLRALPRELAFDHRLMLLTLRSFAAEGVARGEVGPSLPEKERQAVVEQLLEGVSNE